MFIVPKSNNDFQICAETEAENFLIMQFMIAWRDGHAVISMDALSEKGTMKIVITNKAPCLPAPAKEELGVTIKRYFP